MNANRFDKFDLTQKEGDKMNKIRGYRNMLGKTQRDMAKIFGISVQAYNQKEHGKVSFKDSEKTIFKNMLLPYFPNITIDDIFFD